MTRGRATERSGPQAGTFAFAAGAAARGIERACLALVAGLLLALLAVVLVSVAARYFAGTAFLWSEELALWLHVALVFAGLPLASSAAGILRIELLATAPPRLRLALDVLRGGVLLAATLFLALGAARAGAAIGGRSLALGLPEAWRYAIVAAGAGLAALVVILETLAAAGRRAALATLLLGLLFLAATELAAFATLPLPSLGALGLSVLAILLGAPVAHALILSAGLAIPFGAMLPGPAQVQTAVASLSSGLLLAIPFFLLAGGLMTAGGLAERLVRLAASLVGHRRGGMGQTTLLTNSMIAGLSGSSIADAAFGAKMLAPGLTAAGYAPERAVAIVAATAVLPNVIPPSVAFLILALSTGLSVGALFVGGLLAGLLLALCLAVAIDRLSPPADGRPPASWRQRGYAGRGALPALGLVLVILLGIRFGVVTTTEAAALAALYALLAAGLAAGGRAGIVDAFARAGREAAGVGILVASAAPFTVLLAIDDLAGLVDAAMAGLGSPLAILLGANLLLLIAGTVLDTGAAILLLAPVLMPVVAASGVDPVHFGVILVVNLMIGGLTPPVGILVFVAARVADVPSGAVFRAVLPLVGALLVGLAVLTAHAVWAAR